MKDNKLNFNKKKLKKYFNIFLIKKILLKNILYHITKHLITTNNFKNWYNE